MTSLVSRRQDAVQSVLSGHLHFLMISRLFVIWFYFFEHRKDIQSSFCCLGQEVGHISSSKTSLLVNFISLKLAAMLPRPNSLTDIVADFGLMLKHLTQWIKKANIFRVFGFLFFLSVVSLFSYTFSFLVLCVERMFPCILDDC